MVSLHNMVSPQHGDTRGGLPIPLATPLLYHWYVYKYCTRGGVEDTRLKAKDTKKIRGQDEGQLFRGQNLSRPRTGMLKAKAKDQGHRRKCSPKKMIL